MTAGRPPDAAIEPVFVIEAIYAPDAAVTRVPFRPAHLARLLDLRDAGIVIEAGAFVDMSASLIILRAADEAAALAVAREDVYLRNGIWVEVRVRPFGRAVRPSAVD